MTDRLNQISRCADEIDFLYREVRGCSLDICLGLVDWLHELRVLLYG